MKKITIFSVLILTALFFAFGFPGDKTETMMANNVVIQFEGTNAGGNNLWLDNFSFGTRYNNDLTITSIGMRDKNYLLPGVTSTNFSPVATVLNAGRQTSGSATITMTDQGSYTSTKSVSSISAGTTTTVTFDAITFSLNTSKNMKVYITWSTDENHSNDTVNQATVFLPGVQKKIVFEAHTATTCGPCASQNPSLDAFIQQHFDSIVPIKYHVWWPALGDPMYNANIPQARVRTHYNSVSAVPCLMVDGVLQQVSGYTTLSNLQNPFNTRRAMASPIGLSVVDTRLTGDTIKTTITINVVSALPSNINYRLRINAIERKIQYTTAPGSNGETVFYDVFRRMYPSVDGIPITYSPGTYTVEYKYKRDAGWVDSMMYTSVFIQDDNNHEIINAAKGRNYYVNDKINIPPVTDNSITPMTSIIPDAKLPVDGGMQIETMESPVPPPGWTIINTDSNFTFWQYIYAAVGGPSFPGARAIRINYYSYAENIGTKDIIRTKVFNNVNPNDSITFDYAYAFRSPYEDRLTVKISIDGGNTFPYTIFDKQGSNLGTTSPSSSGFVPTASQWGTFACRYGAVTGVEPITNFTPEKFELVQNYPNPFNPTTNIKYYIAKSSFVTLKIYDILGKEIMTLVNSNLKAGEYELKFNASSVPSGVYFYKIVAGNFTDTKKMLIVK
jgi:hypothetical protein